MPFNSRRDCEVGEGEAREVKQDEEEEDPSISFDMSEEEQGEVEVSLRRMTVSYLLKELPREWVDKLNQMMDIWLRSAESFGSIKVSQLLFVPNDVLGFLRFHSYTRAGLRFGQIYALRFCNLLKRKRG